MENKTGKYFKYAIGEIILVVIGILIALSINNWNENRKLNELRQTYYQQLLKDLNKDTTYIRDKVALYQSRIDQYNDYLDTYKKPNLSINEVLNNQNKLNFTTDNIRFQSSTIVSLESTGDIKLIPINLRNKLTDLKRTQDLIIEFANANYAYYMDNISPTGLAGSIPGFQKRLENQPELKDYLKIENNSDKIILSIEYASFLKIYNEKTNIKQLEKILLEIEEILNLVNTEFKK